MVDPDSIELRSLKLDIEFEYYEWKSYGILVNDGKFLSSTNGTLVNAC